MNTDAPTDTATPAPVDTGTAEPTPTGTPTGVVSTPAAEPTTPPTSGATTQDVVDRLDHLTADIQVGFGSAIVFAVIILLATGMALVRGIRR